MAREYDIARPSGRCAGCGRDLAPGTDCVSALFDDGEGFRREDYCTDCWPEDGHEDGRAFSVWRSRVPTPEEKTRQFVDDEVLIDFFNKLDGQDQDAKEGLRFVLALMLMRKKLLNYESTRTDRDGREVWTMRFRHDRTAVEVVNPQMDEEKIAQVSAHVGAIFEVEA